MGIYGRHFHSQPQYKEGFIMKNVIQMICFCFVFAAMPINAAEFKVIGDMRASKAAFKLEELGDNEAATELRYTLEHVKVDPDFKHTIWIWSKKPKAYQHTFHAYGYISPEKTLAPSPVDVIDAGFIQPDTSMANSKVKVTLDRLRVFDYPGRGVHHVLFDFFAQHQTTNAEEDIHFGQIYRAQEGEGAGITGYPVFIGLKVSPEGVKFRCRTINVKNEDDERFLSFLNGDTFKNGLKLLESSNPLSPVVTEFATGIATSIAERNKNVAVQDFDMGLDFSKIKTRAKLREGSYIAVQAPDVGWNWSKWQFDPQKGQVVSKTDRTKTIELNYVVFSISKMTE